MGLFDALQDIVGGITENPIQDAQEQITNVAEEGQAAVEDITNNLGL